MTTTYYLAINNIPFLLTAFPNISIYALFLSIIFPPLSTIIGWMHMKRTLAYTSQVTIGIESSPYSYKMQPGVSTHVGWPNILFTLEFMEAMLDSSDKLTLERKQSIDNLRSQVEHLLAGGSIGLPEDLRLTRLKDLKGEKD